MTRPRGTLATTAHLRAPAVVVFTLLFAFFSLATFVVRADVAAAATGSVSGTVRTQDGKPVALAQVEVVGAGRPVAFANSDGQYSIPDAPVGADIQLEARGTCLTGSVVLLDIDGAEVRDFTLSSVHERDASGYSCRVAPGVPTLPQLGTTSIAGDEQSGSRPLGFGFPFYGDVFTSVTISTNGFVSFTGTQTAPGNSAVPNAAAPNAAIYAMWDDLVIDASAAVRTGSSITGSTRYFVVQWSGARFVTLNERVTVTLYLLEDGTFEMQYQGIGGTDRERGASATIGVENASGTVGLETSRDQVTLREGLGVQYRRNIAPVADAGADRVVDANESFVLDARGTTDDEGDVTFRWVQTTGPTVNVSNRDTALTTASGTSAGSTLAFRVTVTDAYGLTDTDTVTVTVPAPK